MKEVAQPRPTRPPPWRVKCNRGSEFGVACTLVFGARGYKPRTGDEIQPSLNALLNTIPEALRK